MGHSTARSRQVLQVPGPVRSASRAREGGGEREKRRGMRRRLRLCRHTSRRGAACWRPQRVTTAAHARAARACAAGRTRAREVGSAGTLCVTQRVKSGQTPARDAALRRRSRLWPPLVSRRASSRRRAALEHVAAARACV